MLGIGRPIGGGPNPSLHRVPVAQIVASVGPYALKKERPMAQRLTTSAVQASPATTIVDRSGSGSMGNAASTGGGSVTIVIASSRNSESRGGPGRMGDGAEDGPDSSSYQQQRNDKQKCL